MHGNVLLNLLDLDGESVSGARQRPAERYLYATRIAIVRIVDLCWVAPEGSFRIADKAQQQTRFLIQEQTERRLPFVVSHNHARVIALEFFSGLDSEFLI